MFSVGSRGQILSAFSQGSTVLWGNRSVFWNSNICARVAFTLSESTRSVLKPMRAEYQKTEEEHKKEQSQCQNMLPIPVS